FWIYLVIRTGKTSSVFPLKSLYRIVHQRLHSEWKKKDIFMTEMFFVAGNRIKICCKNVIKKLRDAAFVSEVFKINWIFFIPEDSRNISLFAPIYYFFKFCWNRKQPILPLIVFSFPR